MIQLRRRTVAAFIIAFAMVAACGDDGESPSDDTTQETATTEEDTTAQEDPAVEPEDAAENGTDDAIALSAEDEAACRYWNEQAEAPGAYDAIAVFSTMAEMATDGGEVEAAANEALAELEEAGSIAAAVIPAVAACVSVLGE